MRTLARKLISKGYLWVVAFLLFWGCLTWFGWEIGWKLREFFGPEQSGILALGAIFGYAFGAFGKSKCCCCKPGHS